MSLKLNCMRRALTAGVHGSTLALPLVVGVDRLYSVMVSLRLLSAWFKSLKGGCNDVDGFLDSFSIMVL